jgi:predicted Rossmann fold nucleotide-binding protein DprA/Smf involved in DNA uptake
VAATGLSAGQVSAALVCLQLKGLVQNLAGNLFIRRTV